MCTGGDSTRWPADYKVGGTRSNYQSKTAPLQIPRAGFKRGLPLAGHGYFFLLLLFSWRLLSLGLVARCTTVRRRRHSPAPNPKWGSKQKKNFLLRKGLRHGATTHISMMGENYFFNFFKITGDAGHIYKHSCYTGWKSSVTFSSPLTKISLVFLHGNYIV